MISEAAIAGGVLIAMSIVAMMIRIEARLTRLETMLRHMVEDATGCPQHLDHPKR